MKTLPWATLFTVAVCAFAGTIASAQDSGCSIVAPDQLFCDDFTDEDSRDGLPVAWAPVYAQVSLWTLVFSDCLGQQFCGESDIPRVGRLSIESARSSWPSSGRYVQRRSARVTALDSNRLPVLLARSDVTPR